MPRMATEPLTKMTLNLFEKDVKWFKDRYGQGFSEQIREAVHKHVYANKSSTERLEYATNDPHWQDDFDIDEGEY